MAGAACSFEAAPLSPSAILPHNSNPMICEGQVCHGSPFRHVTRYAVIDRDRVSVLCLLVARSALAAVECEFLTSILVWLVTGQTCQRAARFETSTDTETDRRKANQHRIRLFWRDAQAFFGCTVTLGTEGDLRLRVVAAVSCDIVPGWSFGMEAPRPVASLALHSRLNPLQVRPLDCIAARADSRGVTSEAASDLVKLWSTAERIFRAFRTLRRMPESHTGSLTGGIPRDTMLEIAARVSSNWCKG
jgi:hypothetical protein